MRNASLAGRGSVPERIRVVAKVLAIFLSDEFSAFFEVTICDLTNKAGDLGESPAQQQHIL